MRGAPPRGCHHVRHIGDESARARAREGAVGLNSRLRCLHGELASRQVRREWCLNSPQGGPSAHPPLGNRAERQGGLCRRAWCSRRASLGLRKGRKGRNGRKLELASRGSRVLFQSPGKTPREVETERVLGEARRREGRGDTTTPPERGPGGGVGGPSKRRSSSGSRCRTRRLEAEGPTGFRLQMSIQGCAAQGCG